MPRIVLQTTINAPIKVCFNLSRSIDLHKQSMQHTNEEAVGGVMAGLINLGQTVTWRARHFGIYMQMTIKVTEMSPAISFTDEQVKGPFKKLKHRHIFQYINANTTLMIDEFDFESPLGLLGGLTDKYILQKYLTGLLQVRNTAIKQTAEGINYSKASEAGIDNY